MSSLEDGFPFRIALSAQAADRSTRIALKGRCMAFRSHRKSETLKQRSPGGLIVEGLAGFEKALKDDRSSIDKQFTCNEITLDLKPTLYDAGMVRATRQLLGASQTVFAKFLGVSAKSVAAWEQGVNPPGDTAARIMDEIRHDPTYWRRRIADLAVMNKPQRAAST